MHDIYRTIPVQNRYMIRKAYQIFGIRAAPYRMYHTVMAWCRYRPRYRDTVSWFVYWRDNWKLIWCQKTKISYLVLMALDDPSTARKLLDTFKKFVSGQVFHHDHLPNSSVPPSISLTNSASQCPAQNLCSKASFVIKYKMQAMPPSKSTILEMNWNRNFPTKLSK